MPVADLQRGGKMNGRGEAQAFLELRAALGPDYPIIGVGGVMGADDAVSKIKAGANLVQLYTGLIYKGPALVKECAQRLQRHSSQR